MNRHRHRVVFNAARGLRMVVADIARSIGSSSDSAAASTALPIVSPAMARVAIALAAVWLPGANAQIVADPTAPGNQRPTVLTAPNGVPLVNITTPSAAGVSRNTYRQFDVGTPGAILNNSRTATQTQLGGGVAGNPWLATGPARVIVNEVNSNN
ncbi:MAG TPA: ESPR-type extended signal peptide-containing protein, partial [Hydrogenophaga sp.]|uniref:two-partner secretion domain-containing protein n=1 Tax=Hydrogenophaga sp. TaxID=1904254 RepID=UPI002CAE69AE